MISKFKDSELNAFIKNNSGFENYSLKPLKNLGVNSNIFVVEGLDRKFVLKKFRADSNDDRNRFKAEESALDFLEISGVQRVPKKLFSSEVDNMILMSFLPGKRPTHFSSVIFKQSLDFLEKTHQAFHDNANFQYRKAIEGFTSSQKLVEQIESRIINFIENPIVPRNVTEFLQGELIPYFKSNKKKIQAKELKKGIAFDQMTFSVVDFGLNNYLLHKNSLYFLDFEFAGIDDPVKLVSDTLLHPANNLQSKEIELFKPKAIEIFADSDKEFLERFNKYFVFFGIKWCLIILNKFMVNLKMESPEGKSQLERAKNRFSVLKQVC